MAYPSPLFYLTFAVVALIIGLGKGGFGSSFAALATPLLALTMPVPELVPLM
ncbi:MAG: sulfite exporter TauE/SafE family protein, partial [Anaerolineales bacterium]|nr:sulfite exporter TauE/SafE family protein [Anaerolineales bacterium]